MAIPDHKNKHFIFKVKIYFSEIKYIQFWETKTLKKWNKRPVAFSFLYSEELLI